MADKAAGIYICSNQDDDFILAEARKGVIDAKGREKVLFHSPFPPNLALNGIMVFFSLFFSYLKLLVNSSFCTGMVEQFGFVRF